MYHIEESELYILSSSAVHLTHIGAKYYKII